MTLQEVKKNPFSELISEYLLNKKTINPENISKKIEIISEKDILNHYKLFFHNPFVKDFFSLFLKSTNDILKIRNTLNEDYFKRVNSSEFINSIFTEEEQTGVKFNDLLNSAIEGTKQTSHYYEDTITVYAVCWFRVICNHPFHNANKRTGFVATKTTLVIDMLYNLLIQKEKLILFLFDNYLRNEMLKKNKSQFYKIERENILQEIKKRYYQKVEKFIEEQENQIIKIWSKTSISEDYILSMWVVNHHNKSENQDLIYKILKMNLVSFLLFNRKTILINLNTFVIKFQNDAELRKVIDTLIENRLN